MRQYEAIRQRISYTVHAAPRRAPVKAKPPRPDDWTVLEVRRLRETHGMTYPQIQAHMNALQVPLTIDRIRNLTEYTTRSHLVPDAGRTTPYTP